MLQWHVYPIVFKKQFFPRSKLREGIKRSDLISNSSYHRYQYKIRANRKNSEQLMWWGISRILKLDVESNNGFNVFITYL